jgi:hypothetical protein
MKAPVKCASATSNAMTANAQMFCTMQTPLFFIRLGNKNPSASRQGFFCLADENKKQGGMGVKKNP